MTKATYTDVTERLLDLIRQVSESHVPIEVSGDAGDVVIVSADDWRGIQETLYLQSIPGMKESIIEGMNTPIEECSEDPGW